MHDKVDFAIVGAGAIGSIIGAHLARSGCNVAMLARGSRARQIEKDGLRITGLAEFSQAVTVVTDPARLRAADVLIMATKPGIRRPPWQHYAAHRSVRHCPFRMES